MIRNVWAVGRNYAEHAAELGNAAPTTTPLIFLKAGSSVTTESTIALPAWTTDVHHEIELALQLNESLEVSGIALALDLTERKKQSELKAQGHPWTLAKSFTNSCPLSEIKPISTSLAWQDLSLRLQVNGETRQSGSISQMIFPIPFLVDYIKAHFPVCAGDLILTGTPAGVGAICSGDVLAAELTTPRERLLQMQWTLTR